MNFEELAAFIRKLPPAPPPDPIKLTWWQWEWVRSFVPTGMVGPDSAWGVPIEIVDNVEDSTPIVKGWAWRDSERKEELE